MTLTEAVKGTYAVIGQAMTDTELAMVVSDLSIYKPEAVMTALTRCRRELKRITLSDIIDRLPGSHPGVEEAWAMISTVLNDEHASIVWTDEMRQAYGVAVALADDPIAARMAFKEKYQALVGEARANGQTVKWSVCLGWDKNRREGVLIDAVERGRIPVSCAKFYLPEIHLPNSTEATKLIEQVKHGLPTMPSADRDDGKHSAA